MIISTKNSQSETHHLGPNMEQFHVDLDQIRPSILVLNILIH